MIRLIKTFIIWLLLCFSVSLSAQEYDKKLQVSNGAIIRYGNINFSYSNLLGTNGIEKDTPTRFSYLEQTFGVSYALRKNIRIGFSHNPIMIIRTEKPNYWKHRWQTNFHYRIDVNKVRLTHSLAIEYFSKLETKYRARILYTFRLQADERTKILPKVKIAPYGAFRLYYNIGGDPIKQYSETGDFLYEKAPYGLHRLRLFAGISARVNKVWFISPYILFQQEFNTDFSRNHAMNVVNPETGKIKRAFQNYFALGVSTRYFFRVKKKEKQERERIVSPRYF